MLNHVPLNVPNFNIQLELIKKHPDLFKIFGGCVLNLAQKKLIIELEENRINFFFYPARCVTLVRESLGSYFGELNNSQEYPTTILIVPFDVFEIKKGEDILLKEKEIRKISHNTFFSLGSYEKEICSVFIGKSINSKHILAGINPSLIK